jgi:hypothetical protein
MVCEDRAAVTCDPHKAHKTASDQAKQVVRMAAARDEAFRGGHDDLPDVPDYQAGLSFSGATAVCYKATGASRTPNPDAWAAIPADIRKLRPAMLE